MESELTNQRQKEIKLRSERSNSKENLVQTSATEKEKVEIVRTEEPQKFTESRITAGNARQINSQIELDVSDDFNIRANRIVPLVEDLDSA